MPSDRTQYQGALERALKVVACPKCGKSGGLEVGHCPYSCDGWALDCVKCQTRIREHV